MVDAVSILVLHHRKVDGEVGSHEIIRMNGDIWYSPGKKWTGYLLEPMPEGPLRLGRCLVVRCSTSFAC